MQDLVAHYRVGQLIHHKLFDYRGVIVDVDPVFQQSEAWYALMARTKPDKNQPWYHVLVHETDYVTYVAEVNLEVDETDAPITHPEISNYFNTMKNGLYISRRRNN